MRLWDALRRRAQPLGMRAEAAIADELTRAFADEGFGAVRRGERVIVRAAERLDDPRLRWAGSWLKGGRG